MNGPVVLIRHGDEPDDDRVVTHLQARGLPFVVRRPWTGESIEDLLDPRAPIAGAVVYGGGFDVRETAEHPFLLAEERLIRRCIDEDLPLLGLCQGAQAIARLLGAEVGPLQSEVCEFGVYAIHPTPEGRTLLPQSLLVSQSHYHRFTIPEGAVNLAFSDDFPSQAFQFGTRTYGFQFHPEITVEGFRRWQDAEWAPYFRPGAQPREVQDRLLARHDPAQAAWFSSFLELLFGP